MISCATQAGEKMAGRGEVVLGRAPTEKEASVLALRSSRSACVACRKSCMEKQD